MSTDLKKTIHYTTHSELICKDLLGYIPTNKVLVEPFVGEKDLVRLFPNNQWEMYDIVPTEKDIIKKDTLLEPPVYNGKYVITNPPFLAKNKAKDKTIFNKYNLDDLYKIALATVLSADGGLFIIPTNFFTDERSGEIRKTFLSNFVIDKLNIFLTPVFDTTTYSVCAFSFHKEDNIKQTIQTTVYPSAETFFINIEQKYDYRVAGEFYAELNNQNNYFNRLTNTSTGNITKLKLYALDTRNEKIHITYGEEPYFGKATDRMYLTFTTTKELTDDEQKQLCKNFNDTLTDFRNKYHDLGMTNYRDYNRKRISFTFAYKLLSKEFDLLKKF